MTSRRLDWLDPLRGFALLGILLNHLVEEFGSGPWFTNPTNQWPDAATRMHHLLPEGSSALVTAIRLLGWLGDSGPGVFLLVSGVGLAYAARSRPSPETASEFYRRRLFRIFPLYWTMHFAVLGLALAIPGVQLGFSGTTTLLSLLGLRFTDGSFFAISPSWWFVWLILQCYLVFPLLLRLLQRLGPVRFGLLALGITLASRGYGLLFSDSLYYWMTGKFAGTRLAEFAAGMLIGDRLAAASASARPMSEGRLLGWSALTYLVGLAASVTWVGTLVSNLLVTLGLSGLGVALWHGLRARAPALGRWLAWTGAASFPVFLLHQPPLQWTSAFWPGPATAHVAAALLATGLSFPAGIWLERFSNGLPGLVRGLPGRVWNALYAAAAIGCLASLLALEPDLASPLLRRVLAFLLASATAVVLLDSLRAEPARGMRRALGRLAALASLLVLFALPERSGALAVAIAAIGVASVSLAEMALRRGAIAIAAGAGLALILLAALEWGLGRWAPLEAGGWGERPALQRHATRIYGLIPGRTTRLRYNNYDYVITANAEGLPGPGIAPERPTPETLRILAVGDAFTMPEGLPYADGYPALLQQRLDRCLAPRRAQVIDAGITGYGPVEEAAQLRELAPRYRPDLVVYEFFINEFDDVRVSPADRLRNIGLSPRFPSLRRRLVDRSQLAHRLDQARRSLTERASGGPAPERAGQALLRYYERGPTRLYDDSTTTLLGDRLREMRDAAAAVDGKLVIIFVPGAIAVTDPRDLSYDPWGAGGPDTVRYDFGRPLRELDRLTQPLGIPVYDLSDTLRAHRPQPVYFPQSWHWNGEGQRAAANAIVAALVSQGDLPAGCQS